MSQFSILDLNAPARIAPARSSERLQLSSIHVESPDELDCLSFLKQYLDEDPAAFAEREFKAALQLLAERARFITGASGATIALLQEGKLICRTSAGSPRFESESDLSSISGLFEECLRTKVSSFCADSQNESRLDSKSCKELNIISALGVPLLRDEKVIGAFHLFSGRAQAFNQNDAIAVGRLAELINAAMDDTETMKLAGGQKEVGPPPLSVPSSSAIPDGNPRLVAEHKEIHSCFSCRFPISSSRTLCLDCEARGKSVGPECTPSMFTALESQQSGESWLSEHIYTLGMIVVPLATIAVFLWLR